MRIIWSIFELGWGGFENFCAPVALACWFHRAVPAHFKRDVEKLYISGCCNVVHRSEVHSGNLSTLVDVGNGVCMTGSELGGKQLAAGA